MREFLNKVRIQKKMIKFMIKIRNNWVHNFKLIWLNFIKNKKIKNFGTNIVNLRINGNSETKLRFFKFKINEKQCKFLNACRELTVTVKFGKFPDK